MIHESVSFSFAKEKDDIELHRILHTHGSIALKVSIDILTNKLYIENTWNEMNDFLSG